MEVAITVYQTVIGTILGFAALFASAWFIVFICDRFNK